MLGLSQSIRNKKKKRQQYGDEREGERKKIDCQNVTRKNALNVTIIRGLTVITFPIYLDFLVLNSFQLSVWEMSPVEVFFPFLVKFQHSIIHQNWVRQCWECFLPQQEPQIIEAGRFCLSISTVRKHQTPAQQQTNHQINIPRSRVFCY